MVDPIQSMPESPPAPVCCACGIGIACPPVPSLDVPGFFTNSLRSRRGEGEKKAREGDQVQAGERSSGGKDEARLFFTEQVRETTGTGAARIAPRSGRAAGAPVVDVAERILDERLILVVAPLPVDDKFILVVSGGQVAHHRENLGARGGGLGGHWNRFQPVGEGSAQVHLRGRKRQEGEVRVSESRVARRMRGSSARDAARESPPKMSTPRRWRKLREVEAQTRTCLPPYAHTNRVGNTICSYIACCAIGADPPSRGRPSRRRRSSLWSSVHNCGGVLKKVSSESAGPFAQNTRVCGRNPAEARRAREKVHLLWGGGVHHGAPIVGSRNLGVSARHRAGSPSRADPRDAVAARRSGRRGEARARACARERRERGDRSRRAKMFFHLKLDKNVLLEPRHFGKNMQDVLREKLRSEVRLASRHVAQSAALRFPPRLDTDGV